MGGFKWIDKTPLIVASEKAAMIAGLYVQAEARAVCPVDTGNLRSSITVVPIPGGVNVGTAVEYGPYVEFGSQHQQAQPFMGPAIEKARRKYGK
jgi:HK97 gp10 family phage protein